MAGSRQCPSAAVVLAAMVVAALAAHPSSEHGNGTPVDCDVVVAGGSTAALAAGLTAAEAAPSLTVCLTEPTDWLGGQLTSSGVSAIDFGEWNRRAENQPASFRDMMAFLHGDPQLPSACWVSTTCYVPSRLVTGWIRPRVAKSTNLRILRRTVVRATQRGADGQVTSLLVVQRAPRLGVNESALLMSEVLADWYSPVASARYTKESLTLQGKVFIEATENGDVLATGRLPYAQGVELPAELSAATDDQCGQAATLTFYMTALDHPVPSSGVPPGKPEGEPFARPSTKPHCPGIHTPNCSIGSVWTYRRAQLGPARNTSVEAINTGDITQQNWGGGNDLDTMYLFLPTADAAASVARGEWAGGVNLTALSGLEQRAYGWFHAYRDFAGPDQGGRMGLSLTAPGTLTGLSKAPYLRDTRRSIGLGGFRMQHETQAPSPLRPGAHQGYEFYDTVALGNYNADDHNIKTCQKPAYMTDYRDMLPFFVPFRALTTNASNLLTAGKTMAQTFYANSASRLHPCEWTTGVAAGASAVLMVQRGWSTADALANVDAVRGFLNSSAIGQPLKWTGVPPDPSPFLTHACGLSRCLRVTSGGVFPNATCASKCGPLGAPEWLANAEFWQREGSTLTARSATWLKKSTVPSGILPAADKRAVSAGATCKLLDNEQFDGYWLCLLP